MGARSPAASTGAAPSSLAVPSSVGPSTARSSVRPAGGAGLRDPHRVAGRQVELGGRAAAELDPGGPAPGHVHVHPHLEPEVGDPLHRALGRGRRSAGVAVDAPRSCGRTHWPSEPGGRAQERQDELVGRVVVHLGRVPTCSRRPWLMMARRSATSMASSWSWVTSTVVTEIFSCRSRSHTPQLRAHLGVEGAEGLVEQQHLGLDGQGPGQGHALALAPRELRRVAVGQVGDARPARAARPPWRRDLGLGPACGSRGRRPRCAAR